jgi:hypothetical protein
MRQMPQQMLKYLSRMRRKQDLNNKGKTLYKRLTTKLFERHRIPPATHT